MHKNNFSNFEELSLRFVFKELKFRKGLEIFWEQLVRGCLRGGLPRWHPWSAREPSRWRALVASERLTGPSSSPSFLATATFDRCHGEAAAGARRF